MSEQKKIEDLTDLELMAELQKARGAQMQANSLLSALDYEANRRIQKEGERLRKEAAAKFKDIGEMKDHPMNN